MRLFMCKRKLSLYIVDILIAINKINRYTSTFDNSEQFLHSELEWDATIRELQLIGDAINILINENFLDSTFRRIVDFRNQIVHAYFGIDSTIVWEVIKHKLPILEKQLLESCHQHDLSLSTAIQCAIEENNYNSQVVLYLKKLTSN